MCTSEQLADALTKSMVAWRLINVMKTANINAMHVKNDTYVKQAKTPTPWTRPVKDWVMVSKPVGMGERCRERSVNAAALSSSKCL